ncbi:MAG TPA: sulfurtransferase TusA family protein [Gemmobacter sp.]|nr:sulfurtransferase TusA family protein [Gemmobacter sp.]
MQYDADLDCEGLLCPLPVLRARKRLIGMAPGAVLRVRATDRMAAVDLPHFCMQAGHRYLGAESGGQSTAYFIERGPDRPEAQ